MCADKILMNNHKPFYIHFGDLPQDRKSKFRGVIALEGLSVFPALAYKGRFWVQIGGLKDPHARNDLYAVSNRPAFLVTGREVGTGSIWEPLLAEVKLVRKLDPTEIAI